MGRYFPLQKKVPPMPTIKKQIVFTKCKNCGAKVRINGICEYCSTQHTNDKLSED